MFNRFSKIVAAMALLAVSVTACKKDEVKTTAEFGAEPALSASTINAGVLTRATANNTAVTYTWNPYTIKLSDNTPAASPVTYFVQLAKAGTNFAVVQEFVATSAASSSLAIITQKLNSALLGLDFPFGQVARVDVRLKTFVAGNRETLYSATSNLSATPYDECVAPTVDTWGLVGPAGDGWPGATDTDRTMPYSCTARGYVLRMALNAGPFKFRANKAWGMNLGGVTGNYGQGVALTPSGPDLVIATAGTYTVKLEVTYDATGKATAGKVTLTP